MGGREVRDSQSHLSTTTVGLPVWHMRPCGRDARQVSDDVRWQDMLSAKAAGGRLWQNRMGGGMGGASPWGMFIMWCSATHRCCPPSTVEARTESHDVTPWDSPALWRKVEVPGAGQVGPLLTATSVLSIGRSGQTPSELLETRKYRGDVGGEPNSGSQDPSRWPAAIKCPPSTLLRAGVPGPRPEAGQRTRKGTKRTLFPRLRHRQNHSFSPTKSQESPINHRKLGTDMWALPAPLLVFSPPNNPMQRRPQRWNLADAPRRRVHTQKKNHRKKL